MSKEESTQIDRMGRKSIRVHTHIGETMDKLLHGNPLVIKKMRLYYNENTSGEHRKDDQTPDAMNYGIDYFLNEIPITDLSALGLYVSTGFKQFLRTSKRS